jgi:hypothetical protein
VDRVTLSNEAPLSPVEQLKQLPTSDSLMNATMTGDNVQEKPMAENTPTGESKVKTESNSEVTPIGPLSPNVQRPSPIDASDNGQPKVTARNLGRPVSSLGTPVRSTRLPLQQVTTLSPPIGQFYINLLLQAAAFAAAIAFGVYAVKSVTVGHEANTYAQQATQQASVANQLAMLALCLSINQVIYSKLSPLSA